MCCVKEASGLDWVEGGFFGPFTSVIDLGIKYSETKIIPRPTTTLMICQFFYSSSFLIPFHSPLSFQLLLMFHFFFSFSFNVPHLM